MSPLDKKYIIFHSFCKTYNVAPITIKEPWLKKISSDAVSEQNINATESGLKKWNIFQLTHKLFSTDSPKRY